METSNTYTPAPVQPDSSRRNRGRMMGGLLIVIVGLIFLADRAGADMPYWFFSFETFLIVLGVYLGFRHSFKGFGWVIPIAIGAFLLMDDIYPYWDLHDYLWPLIVICVGLFIMFRPEKKNSEAFWKKWEAKGGPINTAEDVLDSVVVFGSIKKHVISKNFHGGEATTVFGGTEINLTQADIQGPVVLELTQIFAGTKLIVPSHWKVQSEELVAVFGGVEDKRAILADPSIVDQQKVLVLKGTCLFGGIDIKSF